MTNISRKSFDAIYFLILTFFLFAYLLPANAAAAPVISNINIDLSDTGVTITWNTDIATSSRITYGISGGSGTLQKSSSLFDTEHSVELTGLAPATKYYYQIKVTDSSGQSTKNATGSWPTFTTLAEPPQDTTGPVISNENVSRDSHSVIISWNTDEQATSVITYGMSGSSSTLQNSSSVLVTDHLIELTDLNPETEYYYQIKVTDSSGNITKNATGVWPKFTTLAEVDTTGPIISNENVSPDSHSVIISWNTDEVASSRIVYGVSGGSSTLDKSSSVFVSDHAVELTGLNPNTEYYYQITMTDISGNITKNATGTWPTFKTNQGTVIPPPPLTTDGWPIGIPSAWGVDKSHEDYAGKSYDYNSGLGQYKDAGNGPYTHYVDNNHSNSTDSNNPYGTKSKPRKTLPDAEFVNPGAVIEIHGGSISKAYAYGKHMIIEDYKGTADKPVFLRGPSATQKLVFGDIPNISDISRNRIHMKRNEYLIMENMLVDGPEIRIAQPNHHLVIRHSEITGERTNGIRIWTDDYYYVHPRNDATQWKNNIVIYNNHIHDNGPYPASGEAGLMGVMIDNVSDHIWVVNNTMHWNADDSVQIMDRTTTSGTRPEKMKADKAPAAKYIFIGGNTMYEDGENAIDVKGSNNVIISQNTIWGYYQVYTGGKYTSFGEAIRINDEPGDVMSDIWVIFNHIYDSVSAIDPVRSYAKPYVIGNVIHDVVTAIEHDAIVATNNTIFNCHSKTSGDYPYAIGMGHSDPRVTRVTMQVENSNNIISKCDVAFEGTTEGDVIRHNIFHGVASSDQVCDTCLYNAPLFLDATNATLSERDFSVQSTSDAINFGGTISDAYQLFENKYGLNIRVDITGQPRPTDPALWDIGAYEIQ